MPIRFDWIRKIADSSTKETMNNAHERKAILILIERETLIHCVKK